MVGLSVILESNQGDFCKKSSKVISKASVMNLTINSKSSSSSSSSSRKNNSSFQTPSLRLDLCYLCKQKLLPGKDIYMYKGDRGFCSVECRCRQIFMDEEESIVKDNCSYSYAAMSHKTASSSSFSDSGSSSSSSSSRTAAASRNRKSTRNGREEDQFAY